MSMQGPGRKSRFSNQNNQNLFEHSLNEISLQGKPCVILDVCSCYKYETLFLNDLKENKILWSKIVNKFKNGIYFILYCFENKEEYYVRIKDYDNLRMNYGVDENLVGREILIHTKTYHQSEIEFADYTFKPNKYYQDEMTDIYISGGGMGGLTVDYRSQLKAYKYNEDEGFGPSWNNHLSKDN